MTFSYYLYNFCNGNLNNIFILIMNIFGYDILFIYIYISDKLMTIVYPPILVSQCWNNIFVVVLMVEAMYVFVY